MKQHPPYYYVGSEEIKKRVDKKYEGTRISRIEDIQKWVEGSNQTIVYNKVIAAFIINEKQELFQAKFISTGIPSKVAYIRSPIIIKIRPPFLKICPIGKYFLS